MRPVSIVVLACLSLALPISAQNTDIEAVAGLQFNFGNPGARALGMGGAFIGLADDASAAEANPAGLTILRTGEISIEGRNTTTSQVFPTGGTYPYVTMGDFPSKQQSVSFVSAVLPAGNSVMAVYYHQMLAFRNRVDIAQRYTTPIFFLGPTGPVSRDECATLAGCQQFQVYPFSTSVDVKMTTFGVAMAHQWGNFSVGGAARYQRFEEEAESVRVDLDAPGQPAFIVAQTNGSRIYGDRSDQDVTLVGGVKWTPHSRFSAGAVFKQGASFAAPVSAAPAGSPLTTVGVTRFHVPSMEGIGAAFRPTPSLTLTADVIHVHYSHLTDNFVSIIEYGTGSSGGIEAVKGYRTKDAFESHAGLEYFILARAPVGIRAGWWRDPAHGISFDGPLTEKDFVAAHILFPGGRAENHYSAGIGVAWPRFQIDAAYDTSETLKTASVSVIARF